VAARSTDAAGNVSVWSTITINVDNSPEGSDDFQTRCAAPGVIKCIGFNTVADLGGGYGDNSGVFSGDSTPQLDFTVKASGAASLKFTVPSKSSANSSGSYFTNFSTNLATQFGANSEFYVEWRQRFSPDFLNTAYGGGEGWKQAIVSTISRANG